MHVTDMNEQSQIHAPQNTAFRGALNTQNLLISRVRFQLGGGLFMAIFLPTIVRYQSLIGYFKDGNTLQTMAGATLAMIVGFFVLRRLSGLPGDVTRTHILLTYSVTFGISMSVFFMLRLDYSRALFISSFIICLIWFSAVHFTVFKIAKIKLAIVPGGNSDELIRLKNVQWTLLSSTQMYERNFGDIVVDLCGDLPPEWERFIADRTLEGVPVFHSKRALELLTGKVAIEKLSENAFGSLLPESDYLRFRQALDIFLVILASPILLIIMAIAALAIFYSSGGPIIFKQKRIGYRGIRFTAYKFRTMECANLNENKPAEEENSYLTAGSTKKVQKWVITDKDDERITKIGVVLRKYRIDELPQILNILKGEMSWIGPRPEAVALSKWYQRELPLYRYRHVVRPGITGWAQINQGHVTNKDQVLEKLHYDFFYIQNLSIWLDLSIMLRTIKVILGGIGAK